MLEILTNNFLTDDDIITKVREEVKFAQHNGNIFAIVYIGELMVVCFTELLYNKIIFRLF